MHDRIVFWQDNAMLKRLILHSTNKALDRYFQIESGDAKRIYEAASGHERKKGKQKSGDLLILRHAAYLNLLDRK